MADTYKALDADGNEVVFASDEGEGSVHTPRHNIANIGALNDALKATAQPVSGPLTDTQLRATAVPVSVSGVATAAAQTTGNNSLSSIDGKLPALVSSRVPVVVGTALPAGTNNIGDVDVLTLPPLPAGSNAIGSVSVSTSALPAGAATAAKQDDIITAIQGASIPRADVRSGRYRGTSGSVQTLIAAQGAGIAVDISDINVTNTGAVARVTIKCGDATMWDHDIGQGAVPSFNGTLLGTANAAWTVEATGLDGTLAVTIVGHRVTV